MHNRSDPRPPATFGAPVRNGFAARRSDGLQPHWPDRIATAARSRRRGGRRARTVRRALAAALLIVAGVLALSSRPSPVVGTAVLAVTRDLGAGTSLTPSDLTTVALGRIPDGALREAPQAVGHLLSAAVRKGEVLTDVRLVTVGGPNPGPGRVAVPIRPADPGTVDLLSPGVHVAVLAVPESGRPTVLATDAIVLSIPVPSKADPTKRLVVLGVPAAAADRITATGVNGTLALRFT